MHRSDVIAGIFLSIFGLITIFLIVPNQISGTSDYGIAPDVYPLTLLWLFVILSAALGIHRIYKWAILEHEPILVKADWVFIIGSTIFMTVAYFAIEKLGFRWAGPLLLLVLLFLMGVLPEKKISGILVAVLTPLVLYLLFWNVFRIPLP